MPGQAQVRHALRQVQVDLPRHVRERPVRLQGGQDRLRTDHQHVGDLCGLARGVRDQRGVGVDVAGVERDAERRAAAVQDLPACGRELERAHALVEAERFERSVVPDLQDGQPCRDAAERQQDDREQRDETPSAPGPHGRSGVRRPNPGTRRMMTSSGATMWYRSAHEAILLGDESRAAVVASTSCCSDSSVTRDCREWTANAVCANNALTATTPITSVTITMEANTRNVGWSPRRARRRGREAPSSCGRAAGVRAGGANTSGSAGSGSASAQPGARRTRSSAGSSASSSAGFARGNAHAASSTRSAARSFALRARGFDAISAWDGWSGFFVRIDRRAWSRNVCFTTRSSREW